MDLILSESARQFIEERVRNGRYATAEDVVAAGLALLSDFERLGPPSVDQNGPDAPTLDALVAEGVADLDAGRVVDGDEFFEQLAREREDRQGGPGRKTA